MNAVYKILDNQEKVTMKHFFHIICYPYLDKGLCVIQNVPSACTGCVEKLSNTWLPNLYKTLQPRYSIKTETCKYSSILRGYNKWYIEKLTFKK